MSSAAERLAELRKQLEEGRDDNLKAVEDEGKLAVKPTVHRNSLVGESSEDEDAQDFGAHSEARKGRKRLRARKRDGVVDVGSADEADDEDEDDRLRSMKRRARKLARHVEAEPKTGQSNSTVIQYGLAGNDSKEENIDRMVDELRRVEKRREKFRRRRTFDEDRADINFINEGNRVFNRTLNKYFDKFESVKKIKDSLERGTA